MRRSVHMCFTAAILSVLATASADAEWFQQPRTARGVARPENPALAEFRGTLGMATEYIYGLPFDPDCWTVLDRMPQADESRFLPDLYDTLWGHEAGRGRQGVADNEGDERQRFLKEYRDAIAAPGD